MIEDVLLIIDSQSLFDVTSGLQKSFSFVSMILPVVVVGTEGKGTNRPTCTILIPVTPFLKHLFYSYDCILLAYNCVL